MESRPLRDIVRSGDGDERIYSCACIARTENDSILVDVRVVEVRYDVLGMGST